MAEEAKEESAKPKGKSKKLLVIVLAAVLLLGGGGAAWFFMKKGNHEEDRAAAEEAHRKKELKARVFVNLEPFTVNLADDEDRFAQVAVVLEVVNNETSEEIKALMPAVRSRILLLLSSKQSRELLTVEGKEKLAAQIATSTSEAIGWKSPKPAGPKKSKKKKKKAEEDEEDSDEADAEAEDRAAPAKPTVITGPVTAVNFAQFIVQ